MIAHILPCHVEAEVIMLVAYLVQWADVAVRSLVGRWL